MNGLPQSESAKVIPGDQNLLLLTAIVTIFYQLFFYFIAACFKSDRVTDLAGGTNFVILALLSFFIGAYGAQPISPQQSAMTILVIAWGVRLSAFLFYRILMIGTDHRFDEMRDHPITFLYFWIFQMIWVWVVSLPIVYLNTNYSYFTPLEGTDLAGIILACFGLILESIADQTKFYFKQDENNKGKWCNAGIWNYSRHPNYFGEIIFWWGIFIGCGNQFIKGEERYYYTIVSPIFTTALLLGFSGLPLLEKGANKRFNSKSEYHDYRKKTSILIPLPHFIYGNIPDIVKEIFLFEWPWYRAELGDPDEIGAEVGIDGVRDEGGELGVGGDEAKQYGAFDAVQPASTVQSPL